MKRIAIYSRKSVETDQGESIKNQIDMCKAYFTRQGIECTFKVFEDEGFSGGNTNRPSFKRMMQLAKNKQFDIIAVYKIDRIARNITDFFITFDELQKNNIDLVSITEGFDPSTPPGKMMLIMLAGFAEMERMNIAQRVKDNMNALAKMGRWSGGTPPTGYKSFREEINGKQQSYLVVDLEFKETIQKIFKLAANGHTCYMIGKQLNLSNKTIQNIIYNPTYLPANEKSREYLRSIGYEVYGELNSKGYLVYNRRPRKNGKKLYNAPGMFVATSTHEPLIDVETWIKANENVKSRGCEARPRISPKSFLSHIVKCKCGATMILNSGHVKKDGTRNHYFICSAKRAGGTQCKCDSKFLRVDEAENAIIELFKSITLDRNELEKYIQKKSSRDYNKEIKLMNKKIKENEKKLSNLIERFALLEGSIVKEVSKNINELSKETDDLKNELYFLERERLLDESERNNIDVLYNSIINFINELKTENVSAERKQLLIQSILKEIVWDGKGKIEVEFLQ